MNLFIATLFLTAKAFAVTIPSICPPSSGHQETLSLPEEAIVWKLEKDEWFSNFYSFEIKSVIEEVELESLSLLRMREEKLDFHFNLSFISFPKESEERPAHVVGGFSLSNENLDGVELYAIFRKRDEGCSLESRKYKIELPHNKLAKFAAFAVLTARAVAKSRRPLQRR